ncbi:hypothetical protein AURDEDRAFT_136089 [Auricularia subglabra TFB-10046 SS5]|nr:hypothetical protein AURDEDRAFT_136089 [Auricularia subglabra TFB-10046 SS5]
MQGIDDVTEHLYGDLSDHPRWITRIIHQHTSEASKAWGELLAFAFQFDDWSRVGHGRVRISHERTFERAELVDWNRKVFDPRHQVDVLSWKAIPKRVWENLVHPALRPADITERCRHCDIPSLLLRRCSLCREVKYCGVECQQNAWVLDHKTTCRRTYPARRAG